jgi:hypothetical protein
MLARRQYYPNQQRLQKFCTANELCEPIAAGPAVSADNGPIFLRFDIYSNELRELLSRLTAAEDQQPECENIAITGRGAP